MKGTIINYNSKMREHLDLINKECQHSSFTLNTGSLVPCEGKGSEIHCPEWQRLGWQFEKVQGPVVYWFEINKNADPSLIFKTAKTFKISQDLNKSSFRHLPAMKEHCPSNPSALYLGCCAKTSLMNRMFWHFGYYVTGKTQGLQRCHWGRPLNLALTIHVLSFPIGYGYDLRL